MRVLAVLVVAFSPVAAKAQAPPGQASRPVVRELPPFSYSCGPDGRSSEAPALTRLERAEPSPEARAQVIAAARAAQAKAVEIQAAVREGRSAPPPYDQVVPMARRAKVETDPLLAELFRRVVDDQLTRVTSSAGMQQKAWAASLSPNVLQYAYALVGGEGCGVDEANTAWLRAKLSEIGWFTVSRYGREADQAAWLLVQHADRDPAFQNEVLGRLEPLVATGETGKSNYAYLFDRVAVAQQRPQRYGTQGRCAADRNWEPQPLEAPDQLDARRASVGLPPEAEYKARLDDACAGYRRPPAT